MSSKELKCPTCGYEFYLGDHPDLVTYWGDEGEAALECPVCDKQLVARERVVRTFEVTEKT